MSQVQTYFLFSGGQATPLVKKIVANTATVVLDGTKGQINLVELYVNENAGATPNLTIDLYDVANTTAYPLMDTSKTVWDAKAVTAKQSVEFGSRVIPKGWQLRVTSSDAAGKFNVIGTYLGQARL